LRYAAFPFGESNWNLATRAVGLPAPTPAGTRQQYKLRGLQSDQTYFFSIRAVDDEGNWSRPSSLINVTLPATEDHPVLWMGAMLPGDGTTSTGFIYRVRLRRNPGDPVPAELPVVVVSGAAHEMRAVPNEDLSNVHYELALQLSPGTYDYYFSFRDIAGRLNRLPNPGQWTGPRVSRSSRYVPDYVSVPPDSFWMGNPRPWPYSPQEERPSHRVGLTHSVLIDRHEVSNGELCEALNWASDRGLITVVDDTLAIAAEVPLLYMAPRSQDVPHGISYAAETGFTPLPQRDNWPATFVTWYGAAFYCNVRSMWDGLTPAYDLVTWTAGSITNPYGAEGWRLPTEAEWEFIAQYNDGRRYPSGNSTPRAGIDGNFSGVLGRPSDIGSYPAGANALGVRDLSGNVWEWCNDWKGFYSSNFQVNPAGPRGGTHRVARGGSWGSETAELLCYRRFSLRPGVGLDGLGFRCIRTTS
jgi:formylglycine-generating enzyme required for sulfatase activity